uniref:Uncharacterized protein n=3 Tax=Arion vulgaris TaxID=1028688 RepID=A0A0B7A353_9EUPU
MNHHDNHVPPIGIISGQSNDLAQLSKTAPPTKPFVNGYFCKNDTAGSTFPSPKVTKYNKHLSSTPSSAAKFTTFKIPDIRLQPPSENMVLNMVTEYDLPVVMDIKMNDILNRLQSVTSSDSPKSDEVVTLPGRYIRKLSDSQDSMRSPARELDNRPEDMLTRENDLSTALKWIRQEMVHMKKQDMSLLKQFIQLQDSIVQLRYIYDINGSCSDISSLDGSTYSLNEQIKSPKLPRFLLNGNSCMNKPSISLPNSPRTTRCKWRTNEIS